MEITKEEKNKLFSSNEWTSFLTLIGGSAKNKKHLEAILLLYLHELAGWYFESYYRKKVNK